MAGGNDRGAYAQGATPYQLSSETRNEDSTTRGYIMKKSKIAQRSGLALALEPRMMFDGAAVVTAAAVANDASHAPEAFRRGGHRLRRDARRRHHEPRVLQPPVRQCIQGRRRRRARMERRETSRRPAFRYRDPPHRRHVANCGQQQRHGNRNRSPRRKRRRGPDGGYGEKTRPRKRSPPLSSRTRQRARVLVHPARQPIQRSQRATPLSGVSRTSPDGLHFDADTHTLTGTPSLGGRLHHQGDGHRRNRGQNQRLRLRSTWWDNHAPEGGVFRTPDGGTARRATATHYTLPDTLFTDADGDTLVWSVSRSSGRPAFRYGNPHHFRYADLGGRLIPLP